MAEVIGNFGTDLFNVYQSVISILPLAAQKFVNFLFIVILVVIYCIFVWKFYKSVSRKNVIELDLNQYNKSNDEAFTKSLAVIFYVLEYIIIFPLLIFVWFFAFTIFLIFLTENIPLSTILILSGTVIAAIRLTSYYKKQLSEDVAKLIPFTLLAVSLLNPTFFSIERVFNQFKALPSTFGDMFIYLGFIIALEAVLRTVDFLFSRFGLLDEEDKEDEDDDE